MRIISSSVDVISRLIFLFPVFFCFSVVVPFTVAFSALTLLVGWQEGHPAP